MQTGVRAAWGAVGVRKGFILSPILNRDLLIVFWVSFPSSEALESCCGRQTVLVHVLALLAGVGVTAHMGQAGLPAGFGGGKAFFDLYQWGREHG